MFSKWVCLERLYFETLSKNCCNTILSKVLILIFTFIHVYAFVERVFSINSDIISENITVGRLSPFEKNFVVCFIESPLKVMKNAFYFISKAVFVLKIFGFISSFFSHVEKTASIRKIRIISKFMTSQPG